MGSVDRVPRDGQCEGEDSTRRARAMLGESNGQPGPERIRPFGESVLKSGGNAANIAAKRRTVRRRGLDPASPAMLGESNGQPGPERIRPFGESVLKSGGNAANIAAKRRTVR